MNQVYMGLSGVVSLDPTNSTKYNKLLDLLGAEGMLMQFERFVDDSELSDLINQIEDNLLENQIQKP